MQCDMRSAAPRNFEKNMYMEMEMGHNNWN